MQEINFTIQEMDRLLALEKLQNREITQKEASRELGLSDRQVRRLASRVKAEGKVGIKKRKRFGRVGFSEEFKACLLSIISHERYKDFGPTLLSEKLKELHDIKISRESLRKLMIDSNLWRLRSRKRIKLHQRRERRSCVGELVQIDGSHHRWFEDRASKCCLIVFIEDATSQIVSARFEKSETTKGYLRCIKNHVTNYGRPVAYYSDKHTIFKVPKKDLPDGRHRDTQLGRALKDLGIELIYAHSSQAKGRVERANLTLQDRLIKEMRLIGISSIEEGNRYLPKFIKQYNEKFAVKAKSTTNAYRDLNQSVESLDYILSVQQNRILTKNLEFKLGDQILQIQSAGGGYRYRRAKVTIYEHVDNSITVMHKNTKLKYKPLDISIPSSKVLDAKDINDYVDVLCQNTIHTLGQAGSPGALNASI